jgi:hypothetical protein
MSDEPDFRMMVTQIGLLVQDTIPESEITTVDAVALLVRENNSLRQALGLPTYAEVARKEDVSRY